MEVVNFLVAFALFSLASPFANAYDPSPLQDICAAINDTNSAVLVNGKFCKNPNHVNADDFFFPGLNIPRSTDNQLGVNVTFVDVDLMPGLNTLGMSMARIDFAANGGLNPPHYHPRASEILMCMEGILYAGFDTANPDHRLFTKILYPGDVIVFPFGMIHFQLNIGNTSAVAFAALNSQNPGVNTVANAIFASSPAMEPAMIAKAFHLDVKLVAELQKQLWVNP